MVEPRQARQATREKRVHLRKDDGQRLVSTTDMLKNRFDFTLQTGIWWDTTMHNTGMCTGVFRIGFT
jgi:hypothetical protein